MLDRETIKVELEQMARNILSQKTWPVRDAAILLGYSRTHMDTLITKLENRRDLVVVRPGGIKQLYAVDVLELFEQMNDITFPILRNEWFKRFGLKAPSGRTPGGERQSSMF